MAEESQGASPAKPLDVITIGRCSVDLYGQQIGSRLEDIASFAKSVGGCPANIAIGTARLGLRSGLITRVGDEQLGRFVREQMRREGVALDGIRVDPARLTALAILSVENDASFPLLFYRDNCADMALDEADIDEAFIASARAVVVTGTHFAKPNTDAAQRKAMRLMRQHGGKIVFDIDYRPNLWGLAGHAAGDERYVRSEAVSTHLRAILPQCDLIVGTEEEIHIAAGEEDTLAALKAIRSLTKGVIVLKRGPMGCVVFPEAIPATIDDGIVGKGFPIEVYNVLGAGDAFMSGFLRGWLKGESYETAATFANACGAFAVSRLLCSPEIPTWEELQFFLTQGSRHRALRKDAALNHVHWATTRRAQSPTLMALAIDHRSQFEELADRSGASRERIAEFKLLAVEAASRVAERGKDLGREGFGLLLDSTYGTKALYEAARHAFWVGRPVEMPGSRPLDFDGLPDLGSHLVEWPVHHTVKCLCFYHPDDPAELKVRQERELLRLHDAARSVGRELLIEIIAGQHGALDDESVAAVLARLYELGIKPDWWKLEPQASAAWAAIERVVSANDPYCRGVVMLGLGATHDELEQAFHAAASSPLVKGFAVGRTIFAAAAEHWFAGRMDDEAAIADMARRFGSLVEAWRRAASLHKAA
ncbi:5-dehydro-2-deoxygluconokinase [Rhizobiales bacterium GAS113]|nr:5-dehydro-2-deoxygluconokinase [Rhizobiales bacterium GAS113]